MSEMHDDTCLLCKQSARWEWVSFEREIRQYACGDCGRYVVGEPARAWLSSESRDRSLLDGLKKRTKKTPDNEVTYVWRKEVPGGHIQTKARRFDREEFWKRGGPPEGFDEE